MPLVICRQGRRGSPGQSWWVELPQRGKDALIGELRADETHHGCCSLCCPLPEEHKSFCLPASRLYSVFPLASWKAACKMAAVHCFVCCCFFYDSRWAGNSLGRWCPETLWMQLSFHAAVQPPCRLTAASFHNNSELTPWQQTRLGYRCVFYHFAGYIQYMFLFKLSEGFPITAAGALNGGVSFDIRVSSLLRVHWSSLGPGRAGACWHLLTEKTDGSLSRGDHKWAGSGAHRRGTRRDLAALMIFFFFLKS